MSSFYNNFFNTDYTDIPKLDFLTPKPALANNEQHIDLKIINNTNIQQYHDDKNIALYSDNLSPEEQEEQEMVKELERVFGEKIESYWTPAMEPIKENCLLVHFKNQEELEKKYDNFKFQLYVELEDFLKRKKFFNMVSLL